MPFRSPRRYTGHIMQNLESLLQNVQDGIGNAIRGIPRAIMLAVVGFFVLAIAIALLNRPVGQNDPAVVQVTIDAASTQQAQFAPTFAAQLTSTPPELRLTQAAPTIALGGRFFMRQFAAGAVATSEISPLDWGAVQAIGEPDTEECGDFRTAWATEVPTQSATITLYYAQIVTPTGIVVYQSFNPGFVTRVETIDVFGEVRSAYESTPAAFPTCPYGLVIPILNADYDTAVVRVFINQAASTGGWNQIDAVELIGIRR
ncbi:MAG: hypothetical protein GYB68_15455 [Chloroflexi bacterium]|nr:hypothetical protein [Chloroflexota bacterium]